MILGERSKLLKSYYEKLTNSSRGKVNPLKLLIPTKIGEKSSLINQRQILKFVISANFINL